MPSNLVLDAKLSKAAYDSYNQNNTPTVDGWTPILLASAYFVPAKSDPAFGAQLYQKGDQFKVVYRGTQLNLADWANNPYIGGVWQQEMSDTIRFAGGALKYVMDTQIVSLDVAREKVSVTGHSQGGFQSELAAKFYGLPGTSLDGPGMAQFLPNPMFTTTLRQDMRTAFFGDSLGGSYAIGQFDARIYSVIGRIGFHEVGTSVSYSLSGQLTIGGWLAGPAVGAINTAAQFQAHRLNFIIDTETLRAQNPLFRIIGENGSLDPFSTRSGIAQSLANEITAVNVAGPGVPDTAQTLAVKTRIEEFLAGQAGEISIQKNVDGALIQSANGSTLLIRGNGDALQSIVVGFTTTTNDYQNNRLILQSIVVNSSPAAGQLLQSEVTTRYDENSGVVTGQSSNQTLTENGQLVRHNITDYNAVGQVTQTRLTEVQPNGIQVTTVRDGQGSTLSTVNVQVFDDGSRLETATMANGVVATSSVDSTGQLAGTITDTPDADSGITRVIDTTVDGQPVSITRYGIDFNQSGTRTFQTQSIEINGQPAVNTTLIANVIDETYVSAKDIILARGTGEFTHIVEAGDATNPNGTTASLVAVTGRVDWWNDYAVIALASQGTSLISLLRGGTPLTIATNGVNFASHAFSDPAVAQIAAALSGVSSLDGLVKALEKGDLGRILIDGGGVARSAVTMYSNSLQQEMISRFGSAFRAGELAGNGNAAAAELYNSSLGVDQMLKGLGQAIAILNIFNSLANGDIKGAVLSAISLAFPVAGAILTAIDFFASLIFETKAQFEADGRFVVGTDGVIRVELGEHNGGAQKAFVDGMNELLRSTQKEAAAASERTGQPMGIIAERLPTIFFKQDAMFLRYKDPLTGVQYTRTFSLDDKYLTPGYVENIVNSDGSIFLSPWANYPDAAQNGFSGRDADPRDQRKDEANFNQIVGNDNFFDSLAQQFSDAVTASGAIAPLWEVETVNRQRQVVESSAGQTTEQIAYTLGTSHTTGAVSTEVGLFWPGHPGDARPGKNRPFGGSLDESSQQTATVIALDLNGDNWITVTKKETGNGVLFDVDNDGFAEETDWIGPRDGILVLDRTSSGRPADGQINRGADLFNDAWVNGSRRELGVLNEIDAATNAVTEAYVYHGLLDAQDPVFSHLKVWMDINGDGVAQGAELQSLSQLGITQLNWEKLPQDEVARGSIIQNGETRMMQSVNLQADAAGVATAQIGNSLMVEREVGRSGIQMYRFAGDGDSGQDLGWRELFATAVIDYGQSTDAAVRAAHTQTSANGTLTVTDEVLDGQEDTNITVSVEQLLKNDRFSGGVVQLSSVDFWGTGGTPGYDSYKQTVTFTPETNFNGVASFQYQVSDGAGASVTATAYIDIAAVDDELTIEVTGARRQASWKDLNLTLNAQGAMIYGLQAAVNNAIGQAPADPSVQVAAMGYLSVSGTSLLPDSVGIIGAAAGKLYFAAFGQAGNPATQGPWVEVWVDTVGNPSKGTIEVYDVDNQGLISIGIASKDKDQALDGQFGKTTVIDNGNGTAHFDYQRTSLWSEAPRSYMTGLTESSEGTPVYVPAKIGPDDAFMLEIKQAGATPEQTITTYKKVVVGGGDVSQLRSEDEYLTLVDGAFQPPADPWPTNAFPIVLDLNDNGFRFIAKDDSSAFYDLAGDGVRRATAWTSGQDALLAYDANDDGKISGKAEISFKDYLPGAATDLAGLAAFDTNADGQFSSLDAQWGKFRVWQDKNEDGTQTADELSTLAQRGIASINLTSNNVASSASGVTVHGVGSYTRVDGTQARLADAQFAYTSETLASVKDDTVDLTINPAAQLSTGGGDDAITGSANADKINAGTGNDYVAAGGGDDVVIAGAGNDAISGGDGADVLWGGKGADRLAGDAGADQLYGGSGDDYLGGGDGDDALWGGTGNDVTSGGAGMDTYHFALGDGNDLIRDMVEATGASGMRIVLGTNAAGQAINPKNIQVEAMEGGRGYILRFSATDSLTVQNMGATALTSANVQLALADGTLLNLDQLIAATHVNHAPTLATALIRQSANQGSPWTYTVPVSTFADVDAGDRLTLSATLANGDTLPIWLSFNAATRSFSGTPPAASAGGFAIEVLATDAFGLTALSSFTLAVEAAVNRAPTVANALTQKTINEDSAWTFTVPTNTFADPDAADTLSLSAKLANGDPLPAWLSFNTATRTFSGTPLNANVGSLALKVVATDALGLSASSTFDVQVTNTNDAPTVANVLTPQSVNEDSAWTFTVPANTFADPDVGDTLSLSATLANGDPLPSWLTFNAATRSFNGTPLNADVGGIAIKVVAADALGLSTSSTFDVRVANSNDAPTVGTPLVNQTTVSGQAFSYTVPATGASAAFADQDVGDVLTLSATLAGGGTLPAWLSFDPVTGTFLGTPDNNAPENFSLVVTATDSAGAKANSAFALAVAAPANRAPTVAHALTPTSVNEDSAWTFTVPTNTFADPDVGDTLSLTATLANGDPLPSWLSFNATTRSFSGTPLNVNVGTLAIKVVATDALGLSVSNTFDVQVVNTNDTPTVANALAPASVNEDSTWTFTMPANTFADPDVGDTLNLQATLANGDPLPSWLSFNAATRTFSGTPLNANVGSLAIKVVATDVLGLSASSSFDVQVANTNDAPTVNATLTSQSAVTGQAFSYAIPITGASAAFADQDVGDVLTLSAKLANGNLLPSWLSFDAATGVLRGTPPSTSVGSLSLQVIATDVAGESVSNAFALSVQAAVDTDGTTPPPGALVGTPQKDVLTASSAYTEVWGLAGDDIINGFWGSTRLVGGAGNDTIAAVGGDANVLDGGDGNDILTGGPGMDRLLGGQGNNTIIVTGGTAVVTAGSGNDLITALWGDDRIDAGGGNNDINAGGGNNNVLTGTGNDDISTAAGNDILNAGDGNNAVSAGEGRNVIVTGEGNDTIGALGANVVIAGAGNDKITLGGGNDWVQAGKGNDLIDAGGGANLFAFNKGDGSDTVVNSLEGADTISLGGGTKYADLTLAKAGDDLVLKGAGSDKITLKDWYKASQNQGVGKLQMLTAGGDFDATSDSTLLNKAVTVFDFYKLVKAFDVARAATPGATGGWAVSSSFGATQLNATAPIAPGYVNPWAALQAGTALLDKAPTAAINPISTSAAQSVDQLLFAALNATGNSNRAAGWMQA